MSRKPDPAARMNELASILNLSLKKPAEEDLPPSPDPISVAEPKAPTPSERTVTPPHRAHAPKPKATRPVEEPESSPSPAPTRGKNGKSSDKLNFVYKGLYLRKDTEKKAKRRLEDLETGQDFSELVEELLTRWLKETS